MEKYAYIPEIKGGLVFSDPYYDNSVWCQFRSEFNAKDWLMRLDTKSEDGFLDFTLYLGRRTMMRNTYVKAADGGAEEISYPSIYNPKSIELGMDTAQIFCGSKSNWDNAKQEASIHTGTDGYFGGLVVLTCQGEKDPAGIVLIGGLDETFLKEEDLFRHLVSTFDGEEITKDLYEQCISTNTLQYHLVWASERHSVASAANDKETSKDPDRNTPEI